MAFFIRPAEWGVVLLRECLSPQEIELATRPEGRENQFSHPLVGGYMPYEIIVEGRGVVQRYWGHVTREEVDRSNKDLYGHPDYDCFEYLISDGVGVASVEDIDAYFVDELAYLDAAASFSNKRLKSAIVVNGPVMRRWVEQYRATSLLNQSFWEIEVFDTVAAARAWLGC